MGKLRQVTASRRAFFGCERMPHRTLTEPWCGRSVPAPNPSSIAWGIRARCNAPMGTKSREVIWGGRIMGAKIRAEGAREDATRAVRAADRAEAGAWSIRMEGY